MPFVFHLDESIRVAERGQCKALQDIDRVSAPLSSVPAIDDEDLIVLLKQICIGL